jgi:hypothetical protein
VNYFSDVANLPPGTKAMLCPGGIGDAIALSGIVVHLCKKFKCDIRVPLKPGSFQAIGSLYDAYPQITTWMVPGQGWLNRALSKCRPDQVINAVMPSSDELNGCDQFKAVYRRLGIPYEERWNSSPISERIKSVPQLRLLDGDYVLIHDDPSRKFAIDESRIKSDLPRVRVHNAGGSLLEWAWMISNACEVHCIDSAPFHLCEHLPVFGKLYLHQYTKYQPGGRCDYETRHPWIVLR